MAIVVTQVAGAGNKTAQASTSTGTVTGACAVGDLVLVAISADNAGTNGVSAISSVTDSKGNSYSALGPGVVNRTSGAANDGCTAALFGAVVATSKNLVVGVDTITVNWSPNVTAKAFTVLRVTGSGTSTFGSGSSSGAGTAWTSGGASSSLSTGDIIIGCVANESNTVPATDTDTTNGSWVANSTNSGGTGSDNTKMSVSAQWKIVDAAGSQTWNGNTGASTDWAAVYVLFHVTAQPQTVDIVAATAAWSSRALAPTGAAVTVNIVAPTPAWSARALAPTGAPKTTNITAPTASWSARALAPSRPEIPQTVNLVAAPAQWSARALAPSGAAVTANLTAPSATWSARAFTVQAPATINITAGAATWSARALAPAGAAVTVGITPATAVWTARALGPTGAAITVNLGGAVSPPIVGYAVWFDANDPTTITSAGGLVSQWRDKSGNTRHLNQSDDAKKPTTGTRTLQGRNVLDFTPNDYMDSAAFTVNQPSTWFVVVKSDGFGPSSQHFFDGITTRQTIYIQATTNKWSYYAGTEQPGVLADQSPHVMDAVFNGASSVLYRDGAVESSGNPGAAALTGGLRVGTFQSGLGQLDGVLAEIIGYPSALSTQDRQAVENYLRAKWITGTGGQTVVAQWSARALAPSSGAAIVGVAPGAATWSARALQVQAPATVNLVAPSATWSARALQPSTITVQPQTVDLTAANAQWSGRALVPGAAIKVDITPPSATWTARALAPASAPKTTNIVAGTATWSARALAPTGAAKTTSIVAALASWSARALAPAGAAKTTSITAGSATWSARALSPAAVQVVGITASTASWSGRALVPTAGVAPQTANLTAGQATWSARALAPAGAAKTTSITAATAAWTARALAPSGAPVTRSITASSAHWSARVLAPSSGAATASITRAAASWSARPFTVIAPGRANLLAALAAWSARQVAPAGAPGAALVVAALAHWTARQLDPSTAVVTGSILTELITGERPSIGESGVRTAAASIGERQARRGRFDVRIGEIVTNVDPTGTLDTA